MWLTEYKNVLHTNFEETLEEKVKRVLRYASSIEMLRSNAEFYAAAFYLVGISFDELDKLGVFKCKNFADKIRIALKQMSLNSEEALIDLELPGNLCEEFPGNQVYLCALLKIIGITIYLGSLNNHLSKQWITVWIDKQIIFLVDRFIDPIPFTEPENLIAYLMKLRNGLSNPIPLELSKKLDQFNRARDVYNYIADTSAYYGYITSVPRLNDQNPNQEETIAVSQGEVIMPEI